MPMSGVYVLNDPGQWIKECIEMESAAQGALIVDDPSEADLVVSGDIIWLEADGYGSYFSDLVIAATLTPRNGTPIKKTLHTHGKQMAWSSSSFEFYQPVRRSQQRMTMHLMSEMENALRWVVVRTNLDIIRSDPL